MKNNKEDVSNMFAGVSKEDLKPIEPIDWEKERTKNNMKADKMFEELGYHEKRQIENLIMYIAIEMMDSITTTRRIVFDLTEKTVKGYNGTFGGALSFTLEELQAINKKCKELGWI